MRQTIKATSVFRGRILGAAGLIVLIAATIIFNRAPIWLPLVYLAVGAISSLLYARDKLAAEEGRWRTRESTLHNVDVLFGIVGGLLAQEWLRHKTSKQSFASATTIIAAVHAVGLGLVLVFGTRAILAAALLLFSR